MPGPPFHRLAIGSVQRSRSKARGPLFSTFADRQRFAAVLREMQAGDVGAGDMVGQQSVCCRIGTVPALEPRRELHAMSVMASRGLLHRASPRLIESRLIGLLRM